MPIITVNSEDMITSRVVDHYNRYFWNRCIITGAGRTGKTTYVNKVGKILDLEGFHAPNFEMHDDDTYMYLKYEFLLCRWYPWDRYIYKGAEPIFNTYTHNIMPVVFINEPFCKDRDEVKRGNFEQQKKKYLELVDMMEASGEFENILLYKGGN